MTEESITKDQDDITETQNKAFRKFIEQAKVWIDAQLMKPARDVSLTKQALDNAVECFEGKVTEAIEESPNNNLIA